MSDGRKKCTVLRECGAKKKNNNVPVEFPRFYGLPREDGKTMWTVPIETTGPIDVIRVTERCLE